MGGLIESQKYIGLIKISDLDSYFGKNNCWGIIRDDSIGGISSNRAIFENFTTNDFRVKGIQRITVFGTDSANGNVERAYIYVRFNDDLQGITKWCRVALNTIESITASK